MFHRGDDRRQRAPRLPVAARAAQFRGRLAAELKKRPAAKPKAKRLHRTVHQLVRPHTSTCRKADAGVSDRSLGMTSIYLNTYVTNTGLILIQPIIGRLSFIHFQGIRDHHVRVESIDPVTSANVTGLRQVEEKRQHHRHV